MGAPLDSVDVVGVGEHGLGEALVVLQGDLDGGALHLALDVHGPHVDGALLAVQVADKGDDAALEVEVVVEVDPFVAEQDVDPFVEEGQLAQAVGHEVPLEAELFEDLRIWPEPDIGPGGVGFAHDLHRSGRLTAMVFLVIALAMALHGHFQLLGEGIDDREADPVQTARDFVAAPAKLAAGMQLGEDHLQGRLSALVLHWIDGNAAAIVGDGRGVVPVEGDLDVVAEAGQRLVDGVVHDLPNEMVEAPVVGGPDVHAGAPPDRLQALQNLDGLGVVGRRRLIFRIQQ